MIDCVPRNLKRRQSDINFLQCHNTFGRTIYNCKHFLIRVVFNKN